MKIIDIHTHAFPDSIAERAIGKLSELADWQAVGDGTIRALVESMDSAGIRSSVICAIATKPAQARGILDWCEQIRSERIVPFASVHPEDDDAEKWLSRIHQAGLAGIKLHPMYQDFQADDPRMDRIYATAVELGLVVVIHSGFDIAFLDDRRAAPEKMANILDRHENLKLMCTHMGGWRAWDDVEKYLIGRKVFLETSFTMEMDPVRRVQMIRKHGLEKIMFGTDWPWSDQRQNINAINALDLTDDEKRAIFQTNAEKLLGIRG